MTSAVSSHLPIVFLNYKDFVFSTPSSDNLTLNFNQPLTLHIKFLIIVNGQHLFNLDSCPDGLTNIPVVFRHFILELFKNQFHQSTLKILS